MGCECDWLDMDRLWPAHMLEDNRRNFPSSEVLATSRVANLADRPLLVCFRKVSNERSSDSRRA